MTEALGQVMPLAAVLSEIHDGVEYLQMLWTDVAVLPRQTMFDHAHMGLH
ncbi:hypothetical protein LPH50_07310 [Xylella taiwanensis]|uniref:Uncharacterized protein n=1 Tax=Xylella taiwanensis TaxID=1444770 RepID=A0ABS8TW23_9GAMM|nr:hypothetical protein [Xylella taiwanensis]MCD8455765.1 hypothetical protein [Xylella taiwanensis]MCD8458170.1 hypothetical protein [Xylella taiwanensis]MCD8460306.1 hypothetical protein [Xylella taiwanensis]MCD8463636.1 hypothetical protein [Xylella taiwanensis]MCD8464808.1 hypothetical protein [Xylella taiwanensis]